MLPSKAFQLFSVLTNTTGSTHSICCCLHTQHTDIRIISPTFTRMKIYTGKHVMRSQPQHLAAQLYSKYTPIDAPIIWEEHINYLMDLHIRKHLRFMGPIIPYA